MKHWSEFIDTETETAKAIAEKIKVLFNKRAHQAKKMEKTMTKLINTEFELLAELEAKTADNLQFERRMKTAKYNAKMYNERYRNDHKKLD
ncbi:MAG: hypothetical protein K2Q03_00765 [Sphingobacteriaceae bacterium]|nr:hypothetical protein [Sphingobacteriaceae bacterium]